jgi:MFS transporter, PAT family, beta-lactamase induction signal transducer AmpG
LRPLARADPVSPPMSATPDLWLEKLRGRIGAFEVYLDKRVIAVLFLGFSSGLPLMLVLRTLSAWLQEEGVDVSTIGLFAFTFAPYTFKFAWAPLMDRAPLPVLTRVFGRRRGWLLLTQACLMAAIFGLGQTNPGQDLFMTAIMALVVSFCSASQDIVIDAYRIELLEQRQLGAGSANVVTGYRIGMWVAGAGALWLADLAGWSMAYAVMALLVLVGVITVLLTPEPARVDWQHGGQPAFDLGNHRQLAFLMLLAGLLGAFCGLLIGAGYGTRAGWIGGVVVAAVLAGLFVMFGSSAPAFRQAVIDPFREFVERNGVRVALMILAFISLFKASDVLLTLMANPFYLEIGFNKSQIAWVSGTFGFLVTFAGSYAAGVMIYRIGILRGLWIGAILMMGSNLMFALQALAGANYPLFHLTILVENVSGGIGTTAFVAYLASLCNVRYTAVQYALLTSFMQMLAKFVIVPGSGFLVEGLGWINFFIMSSAAGVPALALLWWLGRQAAAPASDHVPAGAAR